jgi:hypothetical protein
MRMGVRKRWLVNALCCSQVKVQVMCWPALVGIAASYSCMKYNDEVQWAMGCCKKL